MTDPRSVGVHPSVRAALSAAGEWLEEHHPRETLDAIEEQFLALGDLEELVPPGHPPSAALGDLPQDLLDRATRNAREFLVAEGELRLEGETIGVLDLVLGPTGPDLEEDERRVLEELGRSALSLYEIKKVRAGRWRVRDRVGDAVGDRVGAGDEEVWIEAPGDAEDLRGERLEKGHHVVLRLLHLPGTDDPVASDAVYALPGSVVGKLLESLSFTLEDDAWADAASDAHPGPAAERSLRSVFLVGGWLEALMARPVAKQSEGKSQPN